MVMYFFTRLFVEEKRVRVRHSFIFLCSFFRDWRNEGRIFYFDFRPSFFFLLCSLFIFGAGILDTYSESRRGRACDAKRTARRACICVFHPRMAREVDEGVVEV